MIDISENKEVWLTVQKEQKKEMSETLNTASSNPTQVEKSDKMFGLRENLQNFPFARNKGWSVCFPFLNQRCIYFIKMFLFLKISYISKFWPEALSVKNPQWKKPKWKTMPSQGFELKRWSLRKKLKKFWPARDSNWEPLTWESASLLLYHEGLVMKSQKRDLKNVGRARSDFENF